MTDLWKKYNNTNLISVLLCTILFQYYWKKFKKIETKRHVDHGDYITGLHIGLFPFRFFVQFPDGGRLNGITKGFSLGFSSCKNTVVVVGKLLLLLLWIKIYHWKKQHLTNL